MRTLRWEWRIESVGTQVACRQAEKPPFRVVRGRIGGLLQGAIMLVAAGIVVFHGILGYFVEANIRIGYSVYQVVAVLFALVS